MKIAVTGASGLIGSALVPHLRTAGHEVVLLVRRTSTSDDELAWDPATRTIDADAVAGVDAVVNLSGATIGQRWTNARKAEIRESRVGSTTFLAATIAALDPRPRVLLCAGGVGIYGDRGDEILTEESELGTGFLAEIGMAWEEAAEPARTAGIRVVNFRQGIVLDRREGALARMLTPFRLGLGGRIGGGRQWLSWVGIDDLVEAYSFALERDDVAGPVDLTSPNPVTNGGFVKALGRALRRPTVLPLPAVAVRTLFGEMGQAALLEGQRALPARLLDAGFVFRYPELDDALARALAQN
jgi:uncharacterized protein (TIGR01777 family)